MIITVVLNLKTNRVNLFTSKKYAGVYAGCTEKTVRKAILSGKSVKKKWMFSQPELIRYKTKRHFPTRRSAFLGFS